MNHSQDIRFLDHVFGPQVMSYLGDETVLDIIVNSNGQLVIDKRGEGKQSVGKVNLHDIRHAMHILAQYRGCYLNEEHPECTIELPSFAPYYGARAKCVIPPCTPDTSLTIRKHSDTIFPLADFIDKQMISQSQADFLRQAIADYRNIIVSGIPQSGKTSLTRALINEIAQVSNANDRILVLEDTPEIKVDMADVEYMRTRPLSMQQLVKNTTRMRPDRIIVGEVTDGAAHDLLKSWNIGCSGGITTLHANSCADVPQRLIDLACEKHIAPPINLITTVVHVLVHMVKACHHPIGRRVSEVCVLKAYDRKNDVFIVEQAL